MTFAELVDAYLTAHAVGREASTITTLRERLKRAVNAFGELDLRDLERRAVEIAAWQATLPAGSRFGIVQALRQTLEAGIRWGYLRQNPAKLAGRNPQPRRRGRAVHACGDRSALARARPPVRPAHRVRMVDLTYGHLVSGSELDARRRLDEWPKSVPQSQAVRDE